MSLKQSDTPGDLFYISSSPQSIPESSSSDEKEKKIDPLLEAFKTNGRYFESPNPLIRCYNCSQHGHMSGSCPNPSIKFRCTYCGEQGHTAFNCIQVICHRCQGVGHKISECRADTRNKCEACGATGHGYRSCVGREDPLPSKSAKTTTCLNCRKSGHVNCFYLKSYSRSLYCSKCGEKGHISSDHSRRVV